MTTANRTSSQQNIEAIYPLSPTQQGMLFHSLQNGEMYFQQMTCRLQGNLRIPQWEAAWQLVVDQHPILRTAFVWDKGNQPLQIVCKKVQLPWQHYDWQDRATDKRFETFLQIDRAQGLPLNQAPLMRFTLMRLTADSYYLVWSYHHILIDGWSLSTIIQQVLACYDALCNAQQPVFSPARPYRDYINWLQKQDKVAAQAFWRDRLQGFTDLTSLRIERSAVDLHQSAQYCIAQLSLAGTQTNQLQSFAKEHQLTLNTIIQGVWSLLLAKYSGTQDVLFGATVAGRPPALLGVESMVGLFINTLPVRVLVPTEGLVLDWLRSLQAQQIAQDAYAHTPLVEIQAESEIANGLPLFSTIVVFENYPIHNSVADQLQHLGITEIRSLEQTNYPLTLVVMPGAELELKISYDNRRYEATDLERLLTHFQTLLRQIVEQPAAAINQISLATLTATPALLPQIVSPPIVATCLQQIFEQQVSQDPQAIALVYEEQRLTYQELNQRANQLAHHLRNLGIGPDILVGIGLERSPELIVAILAVLKAGGAYVPLDPQYPSERLAFILADAQVAVLVTHSNLSLPAVTVPVVLIDTDWPTDAPLHNQTCVNRATDLAYALYTSGSTGQPKGVLIPHANVCRLFSATDHWFGFNRQDVWTLFHSCAFDFSVWEIWGALLHGGQLVVVPYWITRSPQDFYQLLQQHQVTVLNQTPSAFQQLLAVDAQSTHDLALRWVIFGGEALDIPSLRPWFERHGDQQPRLVNMYGITETTVHVTYRPLTIADLDRPQGSVVGEPIPDLQLYILDPTQQPQPIGVVGEIYVGGAGLARGYLNRPALTNERFIANPFSTDPTLRLYRTGDLARRLPNGDLEYKGRIDQQVKVRGFRIELGEIAAAINEHPDIRQSVVMVREDLPGHQRLVAYVVAELATISTELRPYLASKLPEFMVPAAIIHLPALPLTTNGKLDRAALPAPQARENAAAMVEPRTDLETKMTRIWQAVLGLAQVSIHDNFFELGGDSILSLQIIARANQAGMHLTPKQLFEQPTIAALAAVAQVGKAIRATQTAITGPVPLTPIQHWLFAQDLAAPQHFNQSVLLTIPADFRPELLEQVLQHLYLHHDALRLSFSRTETGWQQSNAPFTDRLHLQVVDVPTASALPQTIAEVDRQLQANFQLQSGCLLQAALFQLDHQPHQLLIVVHHLAIDGVSWRILLADLETAYQQQQQGRVIRLPAKSTEFQYWAQRLTDYARSHQITEQMAYWQSLPPAADIPVDLPQGVNLISTTQTIAESLTATETQALLQTVPAAYRTQINDLLLSAIALGLRDWLNSDVFSIDLEGHGRADLFADVDLTRTVGWFTTIFPVCLTLPPQLTPSAILQSVKEQLRQIPQQGIGYGLLRYLHPEMDFSKVPVPQISFNYLGQFDRTWDEAAGFKLHPEFSGADQSPQHQRPHLIDISGWIAAGQLQLAWTFSNQLHQPETITQLATATMQALRDLIDHCVSTDRGGCTSSDFPLAQLSAAQLDRLGHHLPTSGWRNIADIYPLSPTQQGMLFHSLYQPEDGVYVEVLTCQIQGNLNSEKFRQAWQQVSERHAVLRTAFWWEGQEQPQQVVYRQRSVPFSLDDWQMLPPAQQQQQLTDLLAAEQQQGFDLTQAPLMRLKLVQLAVDRYQLVWSHHHLLLDGWSVPVVLQEVLALCQGLSLAPATDYRHYIAWLQQQDLAAAETFWRNQLQGFELPIDLRLPRPLKESQTESLIEPTVKEHRWLLTETETQQLQKFAKEQQLTLNNLVQGAWSLLLSRYSGEDDVVFGVTCSGRTPTLPGVETMVGLFINTLPLRVIAKDSTVVPWLKTLQAQQLQLESYAYTPLVQVQGWSDVPNGLPLFESIVVVENYPVAMGEDESQLQISAVTALEQTNYPLVVTAIPGTTLELHISFDPHRFTSASIQAMLGHFHTLLMGLTVNPNQLITEIALLTTAELQQFRTPWQPTPYPDQEGIHQLFLTQAAQTPQAIAIKYLDRQLTYQELADRARSLAAYLQQQGLKPQDLVGVLVERSPEMVIGMLAILIAGGVYVPCDTGAPPERLALILADTQASLILTQAALIDRLPTTTAQVICVDRDLPTPAILDQFQPQLVAGSDPAYVIYTSGSTGVPKGVVVPHRAISRLVLATNYVQIQPSDCLAQAANSAFDATTFEVWAALLNGARISIIPTPVLMSPPDFATHLQQEQVTAMFLTPALFNQMARFVPTAFRDLRYLILGGEALEPDAVRTVLQAGAPRQLLNGYGPTESTTFATWQEISEVAPTATNIPIGRPISNTYVYVLDHHQQPVPSGVPGELYIGGAGLALEYLHQPELTASKFLLDPFQAAGRLYRTGDLVRSLPTGEIEYLGRIDQQVKIRGFRIELGEIAAVLDQHPAVQQSLVVMQQNDQGHKRLVAYVVTEVSDNELGAFVQTKLPDYMVPAAFVHLTHLPLTANGKVDQRSLPLPEWQSNQEFVAPSSAVESTLAEIWSEVLGVPEIGIHDNFFELGGDSILSLQIIARAHQVGIQLTAQQLFSHQSIQELAAVAGKVTPITAPQGLVMGEVPLTPIQHWFFEQQLPQQHHFNQSILLEVPGELPPDRLQAALNTVLRHHDALRLQFTATDHGWHQEQAEADHWPLQVIDLTGKTAAAQVAAIEQQGQELQASFQLSIAPLVRAAFLILGPAQPARLLLIIHHLVVDGVSWRILVEDLQKACQQIDLPRKTSSFQDWAKRLVAAAPERIDELDYWRSQLDITPLPLDYPEQPDSNSWDAVEQITVVLDAANTNLLLRQVPAVYHTQINDVLLTAILQAFVPWTGQRSLAIELEGHGREELFADLDLSRTVGWFTAAFPLHLRLGDTADLGEEIKAIKEQLRRIPQRGVGFGMLRYLSSQGAQLTSMPTSTPTVGFNYLGQLDTESSDWQLAPEPVGREYGRGGERTHILDINGSIVAEELRLTWSYSTRLHRPSTIQALANQSIAALQALIQHCQSPEAGGFTPSDFPRVELSQAELDDLLADID